MSFLGPQVLIRKYTRHCSKLGGGVGGQWNVRLCPLPLKGLKLHQGTPGWLSGWVSAFGSSHNPRVLGSSPTSGSPWEACFSLCLCLYLSLHISHEKNKIFKKKKEDFSLEVESEKHVGISVPPFYEREAVRGTSYPVCGHQKTASKLGPRLV